METKICKICDLEKNICNFYSDKRAKDGLMYCCKECRKKNKKKSYNKNKKFILLQKKEYYKSNHKEIKNKIKKTYEKNRLCIIERSKKYYQNNKEKIFEKERERRKKDFLFRLTGNLRKRLRHFIRINKINVNKNRTFDLVGCTPEFLKEYIEKKFTDGMSWDKIGEEIHIDHIIPLSLAKTEEEVYKLCHYTNLQPLWAEENLRKGDRL
jgi:hypothetical protein